MGAKKYTKAFHLLKTFVDNNLDYFKVIGSSPKAQNAANHAGW